MHLLRTMAFALFAGASLAAAAQTAAPDPVSTTAPGHLTYQSAFAGYQPLIDPGEPDESTWVAANEEVGGGGHVGHGNGKAAAVATPSMPAGMNHQMKVK